MGAAENWDDYHDDGERELCDCCHGDGFVSYMDHPETWDEDCPSLKDHLTKCRECNGRGYF